MRRGLSSPAARDLALGALLFALPALAYVPALWESRLLGPGDGWALHYPLKAAVWEAIGRIVATFSPPECANYFAAAGYDPD